MTKATDPSSVYNLAIQNWQASTDPRQKAVAEKAQTVVSQMQEANSDFQRLGKDVVKSPENVQTDRNNLETELDTVHTSEQQFWQAKVSEDQAWVTYAPNDADAQNALQADTNALNNYEDPNYISDIGDASFTTNNLETAIDQEISLNGGTPSLYTSSAPGATPTAPAGSTGVPPAPTGSVSLPVGANGAVQIPMPSTPAVPEQLSYDIGNARTDAQELAWISQQVAQAPAGSVSADLVSQLQTAQQNYFTNLNALTLDLQSSGMPAAQVASAANYINALTQTVQSTTAQIGANPGFAQAMTSSGDSAQALRHRQTQIAQANARLLHVATNLAPDFNPYDMSDLAEVAAQTAPPADGTEPYAAGHTPPTGSVFDVYSGQAATNPQSLAPNSLAQVVEDVVATILGTQPAPSATPTA